MDWKDRSPPEVPANLRFDRVVGSGTTALTWDIPLNEVIKFYVVYRSVDSNFSSTDIEDPANILEITSNNYLQIDEDFPSEKAYFLVTALDRNNNESDVSNKFEFQPSVVIPDIPTLVSPIDAASNVRDTLELIWNYAPNADSYSFSVSTLAADGITDSIVAEVSSIIDTSYQITGLT